MSSKIGHISLPVSRPLEPSKRFYSNKLAKEIDDVSILGWEWEGIQGKIVQGIFSKMAKREFSIFIFFLMHIHVLMLF